MKSSVNALIGKNVGVIGYNARPIAASILRAGGNAFVSDYWGDVDLPENSTDCIAVLSPTPGIRQRQPHDTPTYQALVENFLLLTKDIDIDFTIIGSGFDDDADALKPIIEKCKLVGNSIQGIKRARDSKRIIHIMNELNVQRPKEIFTNLDEIRDHVKEIGYPLLMRPLKSGGGRGIRLLRHIRDLERFIRNQSKSQRRYRIQQYIEGIDLSSSVLSSKVNSTCISVQGQLIGMPSAGRNCGFTYCGNYHPVPISDKIQKRISIVSESVCEKLDLIGSNGIDFVVDNTGTPWIMEINPRIQGTLEMLERASNFSVTNAHVLAAEGELTESSLMISPVVKMIIYARKEGKVPNLSVFPNAVDRSPEGVLVSMGDPVCTLIEVNTSLKESYTKVVKNARLIDERIK